MSFKHFIWLCGWVWANTSQEITICSKRRRSKLEAFINKRILSFMYQFVGNRHLNVRHIDNARNIDKQQLNSLNLHELSIRNVALMFVYANTNTQLQSLHFEIMFVLFACRLKIPEWWPMQSLCDAILLFFFVHSLSPFLAIMTFSLSNSTIFFLISTRFVTHKKKTTVPFIFI